MTGGTLEDRVLLAPEAWPRLQAPTHRRRTADAPQKHRRSTAEAPQMHRRCTADAPQMRRRCTADAPVALCVSALLERAQLLLHMRMAHGLDVRHRRLDAPCDAACDALCDAPTVHAPQALGHTVKPPPLPWWHRLRILRDTTRALVYLHAPTPGKPRTLHADVKPANILLDDSLEACNRRSTRCTHMQTRL